MAADLDDLATLMRRQFDPAIARLIFEDPFLKAAKEHPCDGDPTYRLGPRHFIQPGEFYAKRTYVDDDHRTFRTSRQCFWCRDGESRGGD